MQRDDLDRSERSSRDSVGSVFLDEHLNVLIYSFDNTKQKMCSFLDS